MPLSLNQLADRYISGEITPEEVAELEHRLAAEHSACEAFVRYVTLHTDLHFALHAQRSFANALQDMKRQESALEGSASQPVQVSQTEPASAAGPKQRLSSVLVAALSLAAAALLWVAFDRLEAGKDNPATMPLAEVLNEQIDPIEAVATLYDASNAIWSDREGAIRPGTTFSPGTRLTLASGLAELAMRSGVQVVVQGPASFRLVSDMELSLADGRLTARVPEDACGFAVRTESARIIDLGTEFGVVANQDEEAKITVFEGEVIVSQRSGAGAGNKERLTAGQSTVASLTGVTPTAAASDSNSYVRAIPPKPLRQHGVVVANYRRDYRVAAPNEPVNAEGWSYLWNSRGPVGDPANYTPLRWNGSFAYDPNGDGPYPDVDPAYSLHLREVGGHPGRDAATSAVHDFGHGPVAAFTISEAGNYTLAESWLSRLETRGEDPFILSNEFGLDIQVHVNDRPRVLSRTAYGVDSIDFDADCGHLEIGDTIYVAIGPNLSSRYDTFHWNFSIVRWDTLNQESAPLLDSL